MFKRRAAGVDWYYVVGGHYCCACRGGSNAYVWMAEGSPLAEYTFVGDIGVNTTTTSGGGERDKHSPYQWATRAQTSSAFVVPVSGGDGGGEPEMQVVLLGNQWVTASAASGEHRALVACTHLIRVLNLPSFPASSFRVRSQPGSALLGGAQLQRERRSETDAIPR